LHPESATLSGKDTLTIRTDGASRISLALAKGALVTKVSVAGKEYPFIPFPFQEGMLGFPVPEEARGGNVEVTVTYGAAFKDPVPENPVNIEDPEYGVKGSISPRGTFLSSEAGWYPDIPGSVATFRLRVEAPEGVESVTAGKLIKRETSTGHSVSEWETTLPLPGIALSAGRYRVREKIADGIPLFTYFLPENDPLAEKFLEATAEYLHLFSSLFGPYPFEKFAVVENFFPSGYGFPSYTLLGSAVVRLPFIIETSLGHEVAHSWWGNGVRVDYSRGNWSEGLTTYVADHLFKERSAAAEGREYRLKLLRDYATLAPSGLDFPLKEFTGRNSPASRAVGYGKAAMVFHMARKNVGDDVFFAGLRAVVREKVGTTASWDDFDRAFPRDRSIDPASFFHRWVDRPGAPVLALAGVRTTRNGTRWKVTGRLVQGKPFYELQVPLRLETEGRPLAASIPISGEDARFTLFSESRPVRLVVDPEVDLFRRLDPSEIPPLVNGIRGSESLMVVAARRIPPAVLEAAKTLLAALGKDNAAILREENTSSSALFGHDVLYLGLPAGAGYLPALPRELSATQGTFTLDGVAYVSPGDALFAVLPHPSDKGKVAALFLPFSAEAALQASRKIPHYGTYGYLVFSGGVNKAKGTWAVTASPTVHEFSSDEPAPE
jgi:aminopeptidase N